MSVLLTGGAGFIGSHIAVELINAGLDPIIADDFSNSSPDVIDRLYAITSKRIPCYEINVADAPSVSRIFEGNAIDAVIHCAGFKAVGESVSEPVKYYRNNLDTTLTILEQMKAHGCENIVFSSSATVYGGSHTAPFTENMSTGDCTNPYGKTKYFIEEILKDTAFADKSLSIVLLRYFNPIGAHESGLIGEKPNGIPNNLMPYITQTAAGIRKELSIFGNDYPTPDGTGVRDYIHIVDLARGHVAALKYAADHKGTEIFNLGTGKGTSVLELVHAFEQANGIKIPYRIAGRRAGDIATCYAGTEKAARMLNWRAEKTLQDMCRDGWRWQQNCTKE